MASVCCEQFLLALANTVLTFFIVGLLYLLRFEHVDNLGAYTAPRPETGSFSLENTRIMRCEVEVRLSARGSPNA